MSGWEPTAENRDRPQPAPVSIRRRRGLPLLGLAFLVATLGGIVRLPYYAMSPGEARGVTALVSVPRPNAHPVRGDVLFTTVRLSERITAYEILTGWLDGDIDIIPEQDVNHGAPSGVVRKVNLDLMADSKITALKVAFERLGYQVGIQGNGALVTAVHSAPALGQLEAGDVVVAVDGQPVRRNDEAVAEVRKHRVGDEIEIRFQRHGEELTTRLLAGDRGDGEALVGVELQTKDLRYDFPFEVTVDTGEVSGPSAGLAFTLALIDRLSAGDLTGGKRIAVTGTIDPNGKVGRVGGVRQKTAAAIAAGAAAFLVPPEEEAEAKARAGKMPVIAVATIDEAVAALQRLGGSRPEPATR